MPDRDFFIVHHKDVPYPYQERYWLNLQATGRLDERLCDTLKPTLFDVKEMLADTKNLCYYVLQGGTIVAEFMLNGFLGRTAQVHFSASSKVRPQAALKLMREVTDVVLNEWNEENKPGSPYLLALYGLTPVTNKTACAVIQRTGFKKLGVLPGGQKYKGGYVDAMVTMKTRSAE